MILKKKKISHTNVIKTHEQTFKNHLSIKVISVFKKCTIFSKELGLKYLIIKISQI